MNDEYVVFENKCSFDIDMEEWTIKDKSDHTFHLIGFIFEPLTTFTLYSGEGLNTDKELYWDNEFPIWNNNGDSLYLRDSMDNIILIESYTGY